MLHRFLLFALTLLFPIFGFSQSSNWLPTIDLNVNISSGDDRIDLYVDAAGVHTIIQYSNLLTYCKFSPSGQFLDETTIDNDVSEDPRLSHIVPVDGKSKTPSGVACSLTGKQQHAKATYHSYGVPVGSMEYCLLTCHP